MAAEEIQHNGSGIEVCRPISLVVIVQRRRRRPTMSKAVDIMVNNNFSMGVTGPGGPLHPTIVQQRRPLLRAWRAPIADCPILQPFGKAVGLAIRGSLPVIMNHRIFLAMKFHDRDG